MCRAAALELRNCVLTAVTTGRFEVFEWHLGERRPLEVSVGDEVDGDVDAPCPLGQGVGVLIDGSLVEGIDLRRLGRPSRGADLLGRFLEALQGSTGEGDPRALAGEGAGDRGAHLPSTAVDHGALVLEQHPRPPYP